MKQYIRKNRLLCSFYTLFRKYSLRKKQLGFCGKDVRIDYPIDVTQPENLFLYDNTIISAGATIYCERARFIMKKNAGAACGLMVVCGNHAQIVGRWSRSVTDRDKEPLSHDHNYDRDIVVEEDVRMGANVTLLSGVRIGRGSTIGNGSVCRMDVPPYAVVMGNPARVIRFNFTPCEILEHEKILYSKGDRLPFYTLKSNYERYYINRMEEIRQYKQI